MKAMCTAEATAKVGRNGHLKSNNDIFGLQVRTPKAMGRANDDFANPEVLFAAEYSACFNSALNLMIKKDIVKTGATNVKAKTSIGQIDNGSFGLSPELAINIPEVSLEKALELSGQAHQACPYSDDTRSKIDVKLTVTNN